MKAAIIGGSGNMGKWIARLLLAEGMPVVISGRNQEKLRKAGLELGAPTASNVEAAKQSDVVIISVPPETFEAVVKEIAPHTRKGQIVVDVTSVKTHPVDVMHRYVREATVLGTHPVFGPGAKSLANHNVVLTPTTDTERDIADQAKAWLEARGANVSVMSPQEHDRTMTVVLGLAHFIAIVAADTLLAFDNFAALKQMGGTTFKLLYTLVESVIAEDPQLYASLQMSFPDIASVEAGFLENVQAWAEMVKRGDREGFAARMATLRQKLEKTDPAFRTAYEDMYRITDGL